MNREVHVRIWERPAVGILRATGHLERFGPERLSGRGRIGQETSAGAYSSDGLAPIPTFPPSLRNGELAPKLTHERGRGATEDPSRFAGSKSRSIARLAPGERDS